MRAKLSALSQQVTTRHQQTQTDVHESITKQDRNNINDPQKKHRLGTVSKKPLSGLGLDKRDDFNFEIVNYPFLDGDVLHSTSYGVYILQLIHFARVCSNVVDFNNRNV